MSLGLVFAIVGIIITLLSPIIAIRYTEYLRSKNFEIITKPRKENLIGKWKGSYKQNEKFEGKTLASQIELNIKTDKRTIYGTSKIIGDTFFQQKRFFELRGGIKNDRFIVLNYNNSNPKILQFGTFILELKPNGIELEGKFVGFGAETESTLTGSVIFIKDE